MCLVSVCFKWHFGGQARLTAPVLCVGLSRVTLGVCTIGVWAKEEKEQEKGGGGVGGHQKAYSAAFPLLKSASKIRKGKWLTCSQSHD